MEAESKGQAIQVIVFDVAGNPVSRKLQSEVESAIFNILKKYDTLAYTIVTE